MDFLIHWWIQFWEYAARSNDNFMYSGSNNLDEVAWYDANSNDSPQDVGQLLPNSFGLYDMSGNVWEHCWGPKLLYPEGELTLYC